MNRVRRKIVQLYKIYRRKRDDRGSAIVIVIIAMAMIGILATTLLWMAYMNYMIKVADIRNKNSFYSAEEVVEQIMAGLQQESADAVAAAYQNVTANWANLRVLKADGSEDLQQSETNRYHVFATTYMDTMIEKLKHDSLGSGYYDRDKLKQYIDEDVFNGDAGVASSGVDVASWEHGGPAGAEKDSKMEMVNDNSIILRGIYVSYTDSENRVSIVQTDICIDVPELVFENSGSIDGLYEYSLIGNEGIEVSGPGGITTAEGSIYAGINASGKGGLTVMPANNLVLNNARRVISKGDIVVKGPSGPAGPTAGLVVRDMPGEDNRVYAKNITLDSGTISLDSKVYVANDLALNGIGSKATLSKEYYGYGITTYNRLPGEPKIDSTASSAIIINGKNSTLDMSGVRRLLIAGRAYIGTSTNETEAQDYWAKVEAGIIDEQKPVMMGESIAIKGGQIAYLVPAECIGTRDGETVIGQNPINNDQWNDIREMVDGNTGGQTGSTPGAEGGIAGQAEDGAASGSVGTQGTFQEVDFHKKIYRLGNKTLSDFGVDDMKYIQTVTVPYKGQPLTYYYLRMDKENAERYFVQYYNFNANKESIDRYFDKYVSGGIMLGNLEAPGNQYTILGNSLVGGAMAEGGVRLLASKDALTPDGEGEGGTGMPDGDDATQENPPLDSGAYVETGENAEELKSIQDEATAMTFAADTQRIYEALTFDLSEDSSRIPSDPEEAKKRYVFNNVIKEKDVNDYLDSLSKNQVIYETGAGLRAVLTREAEISVSSVGDKTRLIVSLGDVKVDKAFSGLIIAKGKITIDASAATSIKLNKTELAQVLDAKNKDDADDTVTPLDMFVNGGGSMTNGTEAPKVDDAGNLIIDYSEIVRYMNWIKK